MPHITLTPQHIFSLLPPSGDPDRFAYILGLVQTHAGQPLMYTTAPFAVQADTVYVAPDIACNARTGHAVLFFEDMLTIPASPPPATTMPPPTSFTPTCSDTAAPVPSYHIATPPPAMVSSTFQQTPVHPASPQPAGDTIEEIAVNPPSPYIVTEISGQIIYKEKKISTETNNEDEPDDNGSMNMELEYPSSPEPTPTPAVVGTVAAEEVEETQSVIEPATANTALVTTAMDTTTGNTDGEVPNETDELTDYDYLTVPRYDLRPRNPRLSYYESSPSDTRTRRTRHRAIKTRYPSRPNLALHGDEATGLEYLLARPPKNWSKRDKRFMKTVMRSLRRAMVGGVGYGEAAYARSYRGF